MRAKRCTKCSRIIRSSNKKGYCCGCASNELNKERRRQKCIVCGEPCTGKLLIEIRKGQYSSFCPIHFNKLLLISDPKELRREIRRMKSYH